MVNYDSAKSSNGYYTRLSVTTKSQSQANNSSVLNWSFYIINPKNHYAIARSTGNVKIDGKTVWSISGTTINTGGAGKTKKLASGTITVKHDSAGKKKVAVSSSFRTDTQGPGWAIPTRTRSGTYTPKDLAKKPNAPGLVSATKNSSTRLITATSPTAYGNGSKVTGYQIQRRYYIGGKWGGWTNANANSSRKISFYPPDIDMRIQFKARAKTVAGWGPWGGTSTMTSRDPTAWVRHNGVWKQALVYVRTGGKWKGALGYVKHNGSWKRTGV